jgi:hypothetical protein
MDTIATPRAALVLILLLAAAGLRAQDVARASMERTGGTSYVVAFPDTVKNATDPRYPNSAYEDKAILMIYSAVENRIAIKGLGYSVTGKAIPGGRFTIVDLSAGSDGRAPSPIVIDGCTPAINTFRITAESPIIVYQYLVTRFGTEAWTPLPVTAWGTEYFVAAHEGETVTNIDRNAAGGWKGTTRPAPSEIVVIAAYDSTRVTITPRGALANDCPVQNVLLKAGEAFLVQSLVDTSVTSPPGPQPDLGGSRIVATRPIGVISGNTRAELLADTSTLASNSFRNMLIEQMVPVELHGSEFVYTPSLDSAFVYDFTDVSITRARDRQIVRVYATSDDATSATVTDSAGTRAVASGLDSGAFVELMPAATTAGAARLRTTAPSMALLSTPAFVGRGITPIPGAVSYHGFGGSMVTLVPRDRWGSFAPYYASTHPPGMSHFINVVTDSAHRNDIYLKNGERFPFPFAIGGTDLVWGTMRVQPGIDNWLEGRNDARFTGHLYGVLARGGYEEFRSPLGTREYEEQLGIAYALPLAAENTISGSGDSLVIRTETDCSGMTVRIAAVNENPVGLASLRLDSAINAKIVAQEPHPLTGARGAVVRITPVNSMQDGSAKLVIVDRTGRDTTITFTYTAERLDFDPNPPRMDFGFVRVDSTAARTVTATNPLGRGVTVMSMSLSGNTDVFSILDLPTLPFVLAPRAQMAIRVQANPTAPDREYRDTLVLELECSTWRIPLSVETANPCLTVDDLDFGTIAVGATVTRPLRICNEGGGIVSFDNPSGGDVLEWLVTNFSISSTDIARLRATGLARGECITISVSFTAGEPGTYRDVARLWASTRNCRDTSVWIARVGGIGAASSDDALGNSLSAGEPNPFTATTTLLFTLARGGDARLVVFDERGERVATLVDGYRAAGTHTVVFDATGLSTGVYHCRIAAGDWTATRSLVKR